MPTLKPIPYFPGYFASTDGEIWSTKIHQGGKNKTQKNSTLHKLKKSANKRSGRTYVMLCRNGQRTTKTVATLILETFVSPRPSSKHHTRHGVAGISNDSLSNLRWGTARENVFNDKLRDGTLLWGEKSHYAKLNSKQVRSIRELCNSGNTHQEVADLFGIARTTVSAIARRETWKYLP